MNRRIFRTLVQVQRNHAQINSLGFLSRPIYFNVEKIQNIVTTTPLQKVKLQKVLKQAPPVKALDGDKFLSDATRDFTELQDRLVEEFNRHFSMRTDLRMYEECKVTLENNEVHRINELGRVTMRNPKTIAINFDDFPSVIKAARLALQNSAICTNPQQENTTIYIPIPEPTRELREKTADKARFIFNDYKKALNVTFCKYSDKNDKQEKQVDTQRKRREALLALKRQFETYADKLMKEKRELLMKEIA